MTTLNRQSTESWLWATMQQDVSADTSDDQLLDLEAEYNELADEEGYKLTDVSEILESRRDSLRP